MSHGLSIALFPLGVRATTWAAGLAFAWAWAKRRPGAPTAALAWLFGFEAAYQGCTLLFGRGLPTLVVAPFIMAAVGVWAASRARPDPRLLGLAFLAFAAWLGTGFDVNEHVASADFSVEGEALNELAKSLWAAAYLLPLWRLR